MGHIEQQRLRNVLATTDIYLQPSVTEAIPVAVMEAAAMGLPVVATKTGGLPEAVEHGKTGLLAPVGDSDSLAAAILDLAHDRERRAEMGAQGRQLSLQRFSLEREIREWLGLYAQLVGGVPHT